MADILIIDDDDQLREMLRRMLEYEGYEVADAENGADGMELFRQEPARLVITDILMPEQEGIETIIALRRENKEVPVIAISGGGNIPAQDHLTTATMLGANRTLAKPFTREQMLAAVEELIGKAGNTT